MSARHTAAKTISPRPSRGPRLTSADVRRLLADPGPARRVETMAKLVAELEDGKLTKREQTLALDVLRAFAGDAETEVRAAVAWQIHNNPVLSGELADQLVRDVARVAVPILRHADRLPEPLLLEIVEERDPRKQLAIAGRREVSEAVAAALVETGNVVTVTHLLRNRGARFHEQSLARASERFGHFRSVADAIAARPELTLKVVETLIAFVSEDIRQRLVKRHGIEPGLAQRLAERGREAATMRLLQPLLIRPDDAEMVARHLHRQGRLTPQFLFRALCSGDLELFVAGMAACAGISYESARILAWDDGILGLRCLLEAANIPPALTKPFRVAQQVALESGYAAGLMSRDEYQPAVLDKLFATCGDAEDREVDELLMQVCDQPGSDLTAELMPMGG